MLWLEEKVFSPIFLDYDQTHFGQASCGPLHLHNDTDSQVVGWGCLTLGL